MGFFYTTSSKALFNMDKIIGIDTLNMINLYDFGTLKYSTISDIYDINNNIFIETFCMGLNGRRLYKM
jgi:hypothetical protein